jgi:hypothetical protein
VKRRTNPGVGEQPSSFTAIQIQWVFQRLMLMIDND